MVDVVFVRTLLTPEQMYAELKDAASLELSNGLIMLAAVTREAGFETRVIDAMPLNLNNQQLANKILKLKPKYVGISSVTLSIYNSNEVASLIKKKNKNIRVIVGGPHIMAVPFETMEKCKSFDIGVIGEGELTIVELLKVLKAGKDLSKVKGLIYRDGKKLKMTGPRSFIKDLDSLPFPAWDLLPDLDKYYRPPAWDLNQSRSTLLITSRGCPGQCTFCDRSCFGNLIRGYSAKYVFRMIKHLHDKYGIRDFRINDDNFTLLRGRLVEICNMIIDSKMRITWSCFARADTVNEEVLQVMKKAGCTAISFGVETGCQRIHDVEKKNITLEQIEKAVRLTHRTGMKVIGFAMIGHPTETVEAMEATIEFSKRLLLDDFKVTYLTPYPGTEIYREADKYGTLSREWSNMNAYAAPCFIPYGLSKEQLVSYRKKATREFYLRPRIIFSYLKSIRRPDQFLALLKGFKAFLTISFSKRGLS